MKSILIFLALLFSTEAFAATVYVDNAASGCSNPDLRYNVTTRVCSGATQQKVFTSMQTAYTGTVDGDTINIRGGGASYGSVEMWTLNHAGGVGGEYVPQGNLNNRRTWQGYPGDPTPIVNSIGDGIYYQIIKNIIVDGDASGANNQCTNGLSSVMFSRIENVEVRDQGHHGLFGVGSSELINLNVHHNGFNATYAGCSQANTPTGYGIYTGSNTSPLSFTDTLISGGSFYDNHGYGIHCYATCRNYTIENLSIYNNGFQNGSPTPQPGIITSDDGSHGPSTGVILRNIVIYGNAGRGAELGGDGQVSYNITSFNNGGTNIVVVNANNQILRNSIYGSLTILSPGAAVVSNNIQTSSPASYFVSPDTGNYTLLPSALTAIDQGTRRIRGTTAASTCDNTTVAPGTSFIIAVGSFNGACPDRGGLESTGSPPPGISAQITSPTVNATWVTTTGTINLSGTVVPTGGAVISNCTWTNNLGGNGFCSNWNQSTWGVNGITLTDNGRNIITVTLTSSPPAASGNDTITVAYSSPGLVAAYGFEEGATSSTADSSGNGNNATITGASWTTTGKYGNALTFNGTTNLVSAPSSTTFNQIVGGWTIVAQVWPTVSQSAYRPVAGRDSWILYDTVDTGSGSCVPGNPAGYINDGGDHYSCDATPPQPIQINNFSCVAATYDGVDFKLYINKNLVDTTPLSTLHSISSSPFVIGGSAYGEFFQGTIDEVRVYKNARTLGEIGTDCDTAISVTAPSGLTVKFGGVTRMKDGFKMGPGS